MVLIWCQIIIYILIGAGLSTSPTSGQAIISNFPPVWFSNHIATTYFTVIQNKQPTMKTNNFYKILNFQIQKIRSTESKMDLDANLNQVLQVLRNSGLHFSAQETPYSLYITIRKRFKPNREAPTQFVPILISNHDEKLVIYLNIVNC